MIASIQKENGTMTLKDLENYSIVSREAVNIDFRGLRLFSTGAPSSGAVCLSTLKTMEQYNSKDWKDVDLSVHRFDEAMRFAYGARLELGDPDFVPGVDKLEAAMLNADSARQTRHRILDNQTQPISSYDPKGIYTTEGYGTSHVVTADGSGMATSLTTTINLLFGSLIMEPNTGIIL
jgi:gamma-glutamyltranspeptidase / glutathione hydrolase